MFAKKHRLDQLKVVSPCSTDWDRMPGDEKKRFCSECNKFVYDFSQMTRRQVEAIVSIHRGRMCARITRRPDGSLLTLETPAVHPVVARRASPVVNATLAAILGLNVPANALNVDVSAAQLIARPDAEGKGAKDPYGGGEALVGGIVFDRQGAVVPNAEVKLISGAGVELKTKTSAEGEFTFAQVPFGSYIMLVEAQGFYTYMNSNLIVDTPYDMRFEVRMKVKLEPTMGALAPPSLSLLDLYRQSDLVAIADIGRSTVVETEGGEKELKTALHVSWQFKGESNQQFFHFQRWIDGFHMTTLKPGDRLLVLLRHRESEGGKRLDGYEATGWGNSIKELDDGALAIYRQRLEELTALFQRGNPDPADLVEWLVRCVEEPVTREDGVRKLSDGLSLLELQRERAKEDESRPVETEDPAGQSEGDEEDSNEQSGNDDWDEMSRESLKLATALTQDHKIRLANTLFGIAELSEDDMELARLIQKLGDERLAPYLISQLRRVADQAPGYAGSLVYMIAEAVNDEDLRRLADDYDDAAIDDESEYDDEQDLQDSTRNRRADGATVAAIKRGAMLKDFLKLVEYKTKR